MIKIVTSKDTNELSTINLKKLQQKVKNKSIVIFVAQEGNKKYLIYWKSKDIRQVLFLSAYKESFGELDKCVCEFVADFLVHSLQNGYLGERNKFCVLIRFRVILPPRGVFVLQLSLWLRAWLGVVKILWSANEEKRGSKFRYALN